MASIIKRNNNFCVVYSYKDANGTPKQKWETFTDLSDAKNRKKEVEYKESVGTFVVPQCKTLNDLLPEYVALYGKSKWALSTYQANTALIANYITPLIGSMKLQDTERNNNEEKKVIRRKYGAYYNVLLSDEELSKLKTEFPSDWQSRIERLSEYMASTGRHYKSHLATIRSWSRREQPPTAQKKARYSPSNYVYKEGESL